MKELHQSILSIISVCICDSLTAATCRTTPIITARTCGRALFVLSSVTGVLFNKVFLCLYVCVQGYIRQCRKHPDMFTDAQLKTIFSNIEEIYRFHRKFLKDLENNYDKENPHQSAIGSCFLQQVGIYVYFCLIRFKRDKRQAVEGDDGLLIASLTCCKVYIRKVALIFMHKHKEVKVSRSHVVSFSSG